MSISGTRTVVSTQQVEARRIIQLSDEESIKLSINQDEAKFNIPIKVDKFFQVMLMKYLLMQIRSKLSMVQGT